MGPRGVRTKRTAPVAQWIEQRLPKPKVAGPTPAGGAVSRGDCNRRSLQSSPKRPLCNQRCNQREAFARMGITDAVGAENAATAPGVGTAITAASS